MDIYHQVGANHLLQMQEYIDLDEGRPSEEIFFGNAMGFICYISLKELAL